MGAADQWCTISRCTVRCKGAARVCHSRCRKIIAWGDKHDSGCARAQHNPNRSGRYHASANKIRGLTLCCLHTRDTGPGLTAASAQHSTGRHCTSMHQHLHCSSGDIRPWCHANPPRMPSAASAFSGTPQAAHRSSPQTHHHLATCLADRYDPDLVL